MLTRDMPKIPAALSTADLLFGHLGIGPKERAFLTKHVGYRYSFTTIPKRRGGERILRIPEPRLKFIQRQILVLLEELYAARVPVHGFVKGRGAISNANAHQARPYLLNLDISEFFASISRRRVHGMLTAIGLDPEVANALCWLCVTANQLPQGAPTSPILANMVCYRLDRGLMEFAKTHRLRYTRYADDITLSSYSPPTALFEAELPPDGRVPIASLAMSLRAIFAVNGFDINPEKLRFGGPRSRKEVTGLVVNEFTNLKRTFVRDLRASLYKVETMGLAVAQADYAARYATNSPLERVLRGRLEWVAQVRGRSFEPYRTLAARFNALFEAAPLPIEPTIQEIIDRAVWVAEYFYDDPADGLMHVQGTAFFLAGVGLVSADHTFENLAAGTYADLYRPSNPGVLFRTRPSPRRDAFRDLVVLDHDVPLDGHEELTRVETPHRRKDPITALGFPIFGPGDEMAEIPGFIINRPTKSGIKLLEVTAILGDGLSGGPIVNDRHQVLGIVQRGGLAEPKQYAVDVGELDKF